MKIVICGGGNLGHVLLGKLSQIDFAVLSLLTSRPQSWNNTIEVIENDRSKSTGKVDIITSNADEVIPQADIIILTTPSFLIKETLLSISKFVKNGAWVGSVQCSGGFFWMAKELLSNDVNLFGFQRVPYISRIKEYGHSVFLKGYKEEIKVATIANIPCNDFLISLELLFETPIVKLRSYLEATLTNSNPILHPSRLYSLFKDWQEGVEYGKEPLFYEEWDDEASDILIKCDKELADIIAKLSDEMSSIPSILEHYGVSDKKSLTLKLQNIGAFKGIKLSMKKTQNGKFIPDFTNRYFIEDIPYGLLLIRRVADSVNVKTPMIDEIIMWAQKLMRKEYLTENNLLGKDVNLFRIDCIE